MKLYKKADGKLYVMELGKERRIRQKDAEVFLESILNCGQQDKSFVLGYEPNYANNILSSEIYKNMRFKPIFDKIKPMKSRKWWQIWRKK